MSHAAALDGPLQRPRLTAEQSQAVGRRSGELALSAAAGSGKTSVLVERFVRAVVEDGLAPARILAITFTERAAGELRERARARLLELGRRQLARDTEAAFIGTFHGFCARVLRAHAFAAGLSPDFAIFDEDLATRLAGQAFERALEGFLAGMRPEALDLLAAYRVDDARAIVASLHAELRSRGQAHPRLPLARLSDLLDGRDGDEDERAAARACVLFDELLGRFDDAYEQAKTRRDGVDFDDLELRAAALLAGHERIRRAWSERFELIMVDEFQDTNGRQLALLRSLSRGNLFTVGDEFQSIYGFRHADVRLFRERAEALSRDGANLALRENFRSRPALLDAVNVAFGERLAGFEPLRAGRLEEPGEDRAPPRVELLLTDVHGWERHSAGAATQTRAQRWRRAEAAFLAERVRQIVDDGQARAGEIVVLLRATGDIDTFERALQLCGLRTIAAVGAFWGHQQIADLLGYLRALANPLDDLALHCALASPLAGCSPDGLVLLARAARAGGSSVWEAALALADADPQHRLDGADEQAVRRFCALLAREREDAPGRTLSRLLERVLELTGYREHVLGLRWSERRLANIHKLLRLARRFQALEGGELRGFLDHVERLQRARAVEPDAPVEGVEPDAVRLMTIHAAKGLEFPVVCVADLGRGLNRRTPELLVDGERIGLRLRSLEREEALATLEYEELCAERRRRDAEEEDRVLYVAMTRARERLLLSGSVDLASWPPSRSTPISWLAPALALDLPAMLAEGALPDESTLGGAAAQIRCLVNRAEERAGEQRTASAGRQVSRAASAAGCAGTDSSQRELAGTPSAESTGAPLPSLLSYSSLAALERCGYRFYLERVLRLPEAPAAPGARGTASTLDARQRGTVVHLLMERFEPTLAASAWRERVDAALVELRLQAGSAEREEIVALLVAARDSEVARRIAAARVVGREHAFVLSVGERQPLLTGVIDLLAVEPSAGWLVVDYKSDAVEGREDLAELVAEEYEIQRTLYALAALRAGAERVDVVHWFLRRPREPVVASFRAGQRQQLEASIAALVDRAGARRFEVSALPHRALCETCPGRAGLCSWGESDTMRERPRRDPGAEAAASEDPLTLF